MHGWKESCRSIFAIGGAFRMSYKKNAKKIALARRAVRPRMEGDWETNKIQMGSDDEIDNSQDSFLIGQGIAGGFFTQEKIEMFREIMKDVVLPSGVGALPQNMDS
ncbi:hypothetical protein O181_119771 [Austropuccinia psidii MF-1]|uniref:Uncharacterized protein n=1 Tax=Austropuccinia psidii MF-1 TaxID=1389203 RepID=A0A9Q3PZZ4_9BASI|nr:hypothetical protein [Austropuccinia psidii MF-1]